MSDGAPAANIVALQIANHITGSVDTLDVTPTDLSDGIAEITYESTTTAASLLTLSMIDPYWVIQRSQICATDETGELANDIDVNWPEGSNLWWRLAMVEGGSIDAASGGSGNLTLTFMDRIVCYLQDDWGPLSVVKGATTRAQFIAQIVARIPHSVAQYGVIGEGPAQIRFVCPDENIVQPVAASSNASSVDQVLGGVTVQGAATTSVAHSKVQVASAAQARQTSARVNKTGGIGAGAALTVAGAPMNATQRGYANQVIDIGHTLKASADAVSAVMCEAIAESKLGEAMGWDAQNATYGGLLAGSIDNFGALGGAASSGVTTAEINSCFVGGNGYQGGTIALTQSSSDLLQVAMTNSGSGTQFLNKAGHEQFASEAQAIVAAGGGASLVASDSAGTTSTSTGSSVSTSATQSDISQLARGTSDNPDEDSWTCIQRLAGAVNWSAWSNGEYLYYMDGPTMIAQQPALYLRLSPDAMSWQAIDGVTGKSPSGKPFGSETVTQLTFTYDNSSFQYESTHKRRGRVQRKTAIRKPQSASQVQFNMVCDPLAYRAGDVFVFLDAGSINGRWIVEDTTRNIFADTFTQFTLIPATAPYPEPQSTTSSGGVGAPGAKTSGSTGAPGSASAATASGSTGAAGSASAGGSDVAQVALKALARQQSDHVFHYAEIRPIQYDILTAASITDDCSGFATACYKECGLADPNHLNYNGSGYTGTLIAHARNVGGAGNAQPGDLCFFGSSESATTHVNVYVGNGNSVSMGTPGDPSEGPAEQMGPSGFLGYYRPDVLG
jgi:hypothetical protein